MSELKTFECPNCGSSLSTTGDEVQVHCEYCGRTAMVPQELRNPPPSSPPSPPVSAPPALPERAALERQFIEEMATASRTRPRPRRSGCGCGGFLVMIAVVLGLALVTGNITPGRVRTAGSVAAALVNARSTPTPEPFASTISTNPPTRAYYAGLEITVTKGEISNRLPRRGTQPIQYAGDRAYAYLTLTVNNPLDKYVMVDQGYFQLQTADGHLYQDVNGWSSGFDAQAAKDEELVFKVPADTRWPGARLVLGGSSKEQTVLPLDGSPFVPNYSVALPAKGEATIADLNYKLLSASLDLDFGGQRVDAGKRYLVLSIRVTNQSSSPGGEYYGTDNYRLLIDNVPMAPFKGPNEVLAPKSAFDGPVVFVVPATAKSADLQVGPISRGQFAKISLNLKP